MLQRTEVLWWTDNKLQSSGYISSGESRIKHLTETQSSQTPASHWTRSWYGLWFIVYGHNENQQFKTKTMRRRDRVKTESRPEPDQCESNTTHAWNMSTRGSYRLDLKDLHDHKKTQHIVQWFFFSCQNASNNKQQTKDKPGTILVRTHYCPRSSRCSEAPGHVIGCIRSRATLNIQSH